MTQMQGRESSNCKCARNGYLSNYRLQLWAQRGIDFRVMINFKNQLFDSKDLTRDNKIPVSEFRRIRAESDSGHIRAQLMDTEDQLLAEIAKGEHQLVDLNTFSDLVDLYVYLPNPDEKKDAQKSTHMHIILSSNSKDKATAERSTETKEEIHMRKTLEMLWIRIQERFKTFSPAFRYFDLKQNNRIEFTEFTKGLEGLKIKVSTADQLMVFNHLDKGGKGFIDYQDFCNLSDERRLKIDPAASMLQDYEKTGAMTNYTGKNKTRSPSRKEFERIRAKRSAEQQEKTELQKYLGNLDIDDLEMIQKHGKSDKKRIADGPVIYGQKSQFGRARQGYSIPDHIRNNKEIEYGISSYHKGATSELKHLLANEFVKEQLIESVTQKVAEQVKQDNKPKKGHDNRTSTLRAQAVRAKLDGASDQYSNNPSKLGGGSFGSRSRSVLPPIKSTRNQSSKGSFFDMDDDKSFTGRKHSLDYASPQVKLQGKNKQLESYSEQRSVYKLDKRYLKSPKNSRNQVDSDTTSVEKLFKKMSIQGRSEILDKIHSMRINNYEKKGDVAKPQLPMLTNIEKERIVEQYFAAKKQLNHAQAKQNNIGVETGSGGI